MARKQEVENGLKSSTESGSGLKLKPIELACGSKLMCYVSTDTIRPYVPETFRKIVFDSIHCLTHPGVDPNDKLSSSFKWHGGKISSTVQRCCEMLLPFHTTLDEYPANGYVRYPSKPKRRLSPAELLYGESLRLSGEFFRSCKTSPAITEFIRLLKTNIQILQPVPASNLTKQKGILHKDLAITTQAFVRRDSIRRTLEQPYNEPYKVLSRTEKVFTLDMHGQKRTVTIDRLKFVYILNEHLDPAVVLSHPHSQYETRYGRIVRFRLPPPVE
ncbi:hypothetical protein HNY73_006450 [Argiope bruennichi]|uniref:Integrase zinc-binding domain-containing protein n=1 Tax=Argiope bruennichi TaxID=94029 RepID=A0A8T0FPQ4_ARGBR|nr:hypothetical protein HNY73_006450 [Argiope bruennichi]